MSMPLPAGIECCCNSSNSSSSGEPCCRTWKTSFLHMNNIPVTVGQVIPFNHRIGNISDVGDPGEPHLHFIVLLNGISVKIDNLSPHIYPLFTYYPTPGDRAPGTTDNGPPTPQCAVDWIRQKIPMRPVAGNVYQYYGSADHTGDEYWAIDLYEASFPTKSNSAVRNFAVASRTVVETVDVANGYVVLRHECSSSSSSSSSKPSSSSNSSSSTSSSPSSSSSDSSSSSPSSSSSSPSSSSSSPSSSSPSSSSPSSSSDSSSSSSRNPNNCCSETPPVGNAPVGVQLFVLCTTTSGLECECSWISQGGGVWVLESSTCV